MPPSGDISRRGVSCAFHQLEAGIRQKHPEIGSPASEMRAVSGVAPHWAHESAGT
ncbi:hypothetical protein PACID_28910 [Acidipropionibacterium acidipropionici ATCC 4875]|uniref:Uncharacterized protein n=1 Tax=Acidipropionibacterium acidipropionici (strain ATCC 4875 / DSM 20272 / JCM 6432 / NBRC 12425 / NCIMB 8070 / 4) TaxID=1171373 RepID=K7S7S5_ACIA4|nr:hypothetical protein PACID_28910 [Acidipropionibacterium acidipropionici ATCC 4875]